MTKRPLVPGIIGALFVIAGCADDPTSSLREGINSVTTSLSYVEIVVGDSVPVTAEARDAQGNALEVLPTVTSAAPAVALVSVDEEASGQPAPSTIFNIVGVSFGETVVTAEAGGLSATITVRTVPAALNIPNFPGTITSGASITLAPTVVGSDGSVITGLTVSWSTADTNIATIDAVTGLLTARSPIFDALTSAIVSAVAITGTVALDDSAVNGLYNTANLETELSLFVNSAPFAGTLSAASVTGGQFLTITRGAGEPDFDSDTEVFLDGVPVASIVSVTAAAIRVALPAFSTFGTVELVTTNVGPDQISFATTIAQVAPLPFEGTTSATTADPFDAITLTPPAALWDGFENFTFGGIAVWVVSQDATSAVIRLPSVGSTGPAELFLLQGADKSGRFVDIDMLSVFTQNGDPAAGVDLLPAVPTAFFTQLSGADDFYELDNSGGGFAFLISIGLAWQTGADLDIESVDCAFTVFVGTGNGASLANPEATSESIPAGDCWLLWLRNFGPDPQNIAEVTLTSP